MGAEWDALHILLVQNHLRPILGSAVDTWATVFVAIGTVGAVAYALFRDLFVVEGCQLGFGAGPSF